MQRSLMLPYSIGVILCDLLKSLRFCEDFEGAGNNKVRGKGSLGGLDRK